MLERLNGRWLMTFRLSLRTCAHVEVNLVGIHHIGYCTSRARSLYFTLAVSTYAIQHR
jgi:hypothetical protein